MVLSRPGVNGNRNCVGLSERFFTRVTAFELDDIEVILSHVEPLSDGTSVDAHSPESTEFFLGIVLEIQQQIYELHEGLVRVFLDCTPAGADYMRMRTQKVKAHLKADFLSADQLQVILQFTPFEIRSICTPIEFVIDARYWSSEINSQYSVIFLGELWQKKFRALSEAVRTEDLSVTCDPANPNLWPRAPPILGRPYTTEEWQDLGENIPSALKHPGFAVLLHRIMEVLNEEPRELETLNTQHLSSHAVSDSSQADKAPSQHDSGKGGEDMDEDMFLVLDDNYSDNLDLAGISCSLRLRSFQPNSSVATELLSSESLKHVHKAEVTDMEERKAIYATLLEEAVICQNVDTKAKFIAQLGSVGKAEYGIICLEQDIEHYNNLLVLIQEKIEADQKAIEALYERRKKALERENILRKLETTYSTTSLELSRCRKGLHDRNSSSRTAGAGNAHFAANAQIIQPEASAANGTSRLRKLPPNSSLHPKSPCSLNDDPGKSKQLGIGSGATSKASEVDQEGGSLRLCGPYGSDSASSIKGCVTWGLLHGGGNGLNIVGVGWLYALTSDQQSSDYFLKEGKIDAETAEFLKRRAHNDSFVWGWVRIATADPALDHLDLKCPPQKNKLRQWVKTAV
ncbi:hypothetical protein RUND412_009938 [Rhizina undulata]